VKDIIFEEFLLSDRRDRNQIRLKSMRIGIEPEDLLAEFDFGALLALQKCRPDEDPIKYICIQAFNHVRHVMQRHYTRSIIQKCISCGSERVFRYRSPCIKCKKRSFQNIDRFEDLTKAEFCCSS